MDRVDANILLCAFDRDRLGEHPHAALRRAVGTAGGHADLADDRRDVDNRPALAGLAHGEHSTLGAVEHAGQVHVVLQRPVRESEFPDQPQHGDPSIVNQHVHPAVRRVDRVHHPVPVGLAGDVVRQGFGEATGGADIGGDFLRPFPVAIGAIDDRPFLSEALRGRAAQPRHRRRPRHQCDLARQTTHRNLLKRKGATGVPTAPPKRH